MNNHLKGKIYTSSLFIAILCSLPTQRALAQESYVVQENDSLATIAEQFEVSISDLKTWNQLESDQVPVGQNLVISEKGASSQEKLFHEGTEDDVETGDSIETTSETTVDSQPVQPRTYSAASTYVVQRGDYLYKIAKEHGVTVQNLIDWNKLRNNYIYVGDVLIVAQPNLNPVNNNQNQEVSQTVTNHNSTASNNLVAKTYTVKRGDFLYKIARQYGVTVQNLKDWNHLTSNYIYVGDILNVSKPVLQDKRQDSKPTTETQEKTSVETYTVKRGDYLYKIASQYGVTVQNIKDWNNLSSNYIYVGDVLKVSLPKTSDLAKPVKEERTPESRIKDKATSEKVESKPLKTYTVKKGDYLYKIAVQYGVTVQNLKDWNHLKSNYIYVGDVLKVSNPADSEVVKEEKTVETAPQTSAESKEKTSQEVTVSPAKTYTVQAGDYLYKIGQQFGVSVEQIKAWNNLTSNYIYVGDQLIVAPGNVKKNESNESNGQVLNGTHWAVQSVLNKYRNSPVNVFYESMVNGDNRTASLRGDTAMYGASVPKLVLVAFAQDQIAKGNLSWNTSFPYSNRIYDHSTAYLPGGSGTIQYLPNYWNRSYTVLDLVNRTIKDSDNLASNMLLHYVGYGNRAEFDKFTQSVYGESTYHRNLTPRQYNKVLDHIWQQEETVVKKALDRTAYDGTKIDQIPVNTYQKIGAWWPHYNHSAGVVEGKRPFILSILTNYWADSQIGKLANEIYQAVIK